MSKHYSGGYFVDENDKPYGVKHILNKPRVSTFPWLYDLAMGNVSGVSVLRKYGHNAAVGATLETIWPNSELYPYLSSADKLEFLSDDDEDGGAGTDTGALTMTVYGLDASWAEQSETVTLNGTTLVESSGTYIRVFRAIVNTAGSLGWNKGNITIRDKTNDDTIGLLPATFNRTLMAMWTVPADYTAYVVDWYVSSSVAKAVEAGLFVRPLGEVFAPRHYIDFTLESQHHPLPIPIPVEAKSDIEVRALATGGGEIGRASCRERV